MLSQARFPLVWLTKSAIYFLLSYADCNCPCCKFIFLPRVFAHWKIRTSGGEWKKNRWIEHLIKSNLISVRHAGNERYVGKYFIEWFNFSVFQQYSIGVWQTETSGKVIPKWGMGTLSSQSVGTSCLQIIIPHSVVRLFIYCRCREMINFNSWQWQTTIRCMLC